MSATSTLPAALDLAARGFLVFPVSRQKRPLVSRNWQEVATRDEKQLRALWNQFPEANPAVLADGLVVIDTDGPEAEELLSGMPALPRTYTVKTARGYHRYFRLPSGVRVKNSKLSPHIDVKSDGGYVVAAGAIHESGVVYTVIDTAEIAAAPEWVIRRLGEGAHRASANANPSATIPPGERNNTLTSLAGKLRRAGLDAESIEAALRIHNQQHCNPPLPEDEVRNIARSIGRYEAPSNPEVVADDDDVLALRDMPEDALDGRLGDICSTRMKDFPRAYGYLALLGVGSVLAPRCAKIRTNLYVAPVGGVHTGKSMAIRCAEGLLNPPEDSILKLMSGSAEGLVADTSAALGEARLYAPDELRHMLEKAQIEHASFASILNRAFYEDEFRLRVARQQQLDFNCRLSILGGVPDDLFGDLFGSATIGGFYDRFIFGLCPTGFTYDYKPFDGIPALYRGSTPWPVAVAVDHSVWEAKSAWLKDDPNLNPRVVEIGLRVAVICASFDGRTILRGENLGATLAFVRYQTKVRELLQPNPGITLDAKLAHKILEKLRRIPPCQWINRRAVERSVHTERFGPSQVERTFASLFFNGEIERMTDGSKKLIRLAVEELAAESEKGASAKSKGLNGNGTHANASTSDAGNGVGAEDRL